MRSWLLGGVQGQWRDAGSRGRQPRVQGDATAAAGTTAADTTKPDISPRIAAPSCFQARSSLSASTCTAWATASTPHGSVLLIGDQSACCVASIDEAVKPGRMPQVPVSWPGRRGGTVTGIRTGHSHIPAPSRSAFWFRSTVRAVKVPWSSAEPHSSRRRRIPWIRGGARRIDHWRMDTTGRLALQPTWCVRGCAASPRHRDASRRSVIRSPPPSRGASPRRWMISCLSRLAAVDVFTSPIDAGRRWMSRDRTLSAI